MNAPLIQNIEKLVAARHTTKARAQIAELLRRSNANDSSFFLACDWYRRLGLFSEGLRLILQKGQGVKLRPANSVDRQKLIWLARFLNSLGASEFAVQVLEKVELHSAQEFQYAAGIALADFNHEKAHFYYSKMLEFDSDPKSDRVQIALLGLADALAGQGRHAEAIAMAEKYFPFVAAPTVKGIYHQALGEYFARAGQFAKAKKQLEQAAPYFSAHDETPDHAIYKKWLGFTLAKTGQLKHGEKLLKEAMAMIRNLSIRDEAWLDIVRLKNELCIASATEKRHLAFFPGIKKGLARSAEHECTIGPTKAKLAVEWDCGEFLWKKNRYLEAPKEIRLLAMLRIAQESGLPLYRALSLLWPEEFFSLPSLEQRLQQLLKRLRREYRCDVFQREGRLFLGEGDWDNVCVVLGKQHSKPSFLEKHPSFMMKHLLAYYAIGSTQMAKYVRLWIEKGWVRSEGKGKATQYFVV